MSVFLPGESHGQRNMVGSVHGVAKSLTQLKQLSTAQHSKMHTLKCVFLILYFKSTKGEDYFISVLT